MGAEGAELPNTTVSGAGSCKDCKECVELLVRAGAGLTGRHQASPDPPVAEVGLELGCTATLHRRASSFDQSHEDIRCLRF